MNAPVVVAIELPATLQDFRLPPGVQQRLQLLLDRQDQGLTLTVAEREEAQGLVDMAEWLSLLRLQSQRIAQQIASQP